MRLQTRNFEIDTQPFFLEIIAGKYQIALTETMMVNPDSKYKLEAFRHSEDSTEYTLFGQSLFIEKKV